MRIRILALFWLMTLKTQAEAVKEFEKALAIAPNAPDADQLRQEIQKLKASK